MRQISIKYDDSNDVLYVRYVDAALKTSISCSDDNLVLNTTADGKIEGMIIVFLTEFSSNYFAECLIGTDTPQDLIDAVLMYMSCK